MNFRLAGAEGAEGELVVDRRKKLVYSPEVGTTVSVVDDSLVLSNRLNGGEAIFGYGRRQYIDPDGQ